MKTNAKIIIQRGNKEITIYIEDGDWEHVPEVRFIADVEVRETSETMAHECEPPVRSTNRVSQCQKNINDFLRPYDLDG